MARKNVFGVKETIRYMKTISNKIDDLSNPMRKVGFFMEAEVKQSMSGNRAEHKSVDTGHLRRSVVGTSNKSSATIATNVKYGKFIEFGTTKRKFEGRHHFRNSLARNKRRIISFIQSDIKADIKTTKFKKPRIPTK